MNHRILLLLFAVLLPLPDASAQQSATASPVRPPNIVLLMADDLGWRDLQCYGSQTHETPYLNQLARQGVRFTNAYAPCTVCSPTRAAMLTGQSPARLHLTDWIEFGKDYVQPFARLGEPDWTQSLPTSATTLAEALQRKGYRTAHLGKWHLGEGVDPVDHGFDMNVGGTEHGFPPGGFILPNMLDLEGAGEGEYLTDYLTRRSIDWIESHRDEPFFLNLWYYAVHKPIEGKAALTNYYQGKIRPGDLHDNASYAAMVHAVDESVGRVLAAIDRLGVADNTVVVFLSDNGGLSHNYGTRDPVTNNYPLRRGKGSAYEGGLRVPMIVRWPGVTPDPAAGGAEELSAVCDEPVIGTDLYATVAAALDLEVDQGVLDGADIRPVLSQPSGSLSREAIYWHYPHYHPGADGPFSVIRSGDWKLIHRHSTDAVELYNLAKDPSEAWDVSENYPQQAARLKTQLQTWRKKVGAQMPPTNPNYDPHRVAEHQWVDTER